MRPVRHCLSNPESKKKTHLVGAVGVLGQHVGVAEHLHGEEAPLPVLVRLGEVVATPTGATKVSSAIIKHSSAGERYFERRTRPGRGIYEM